MNLITADEKSKLDVLVLENLPEDQLLISQILNTIGIRKITVYPDPAAAIAIMKQGRIFDLCLVDWHLDGNMTGVDFCQEAIKLNKIMPVIFLTSKNDVYSALDAQVAGAQDYIVKRFHDPHFDKEIEIKINSAVKITKFRSEYRLKEVEKYSSYFRNQPDAVPYKKHA